MTYTTTIREMTSCFMQMLQKIEETGEIELLVELFSNDAELMNLAMLEPLKGKEGAHQFWDKYLSVFNQIHSEFTNVIENNDASVL